MAKAPAAKKPAAKKAPAKKPAAKKPAAKAAAAKKPAAKKAPAKKPAAKNAPRFDLSSELQRVTGVDLTRIDGIGVMVAQTLLSEVGLVRCRAEGRRRLYSLEPERLRPMHDWVARYAQVMNERLDRMDDYLQELQRQGEGQ